MDSRGDKLTSVRRRSIPAICVSRQCHPPPAGPSCLSLAAPTSAAYSRVCTMDHPPANARTRSPDAGRLTHSITRAPTQSRTRSHPHARTLAAYSHKGTYSRSYPRPRRLTRGAPSMAKTTWRSRMDGLYQYAPPRYVMPCALLNPRLLHDTYTPPCPPLPLTRTQTCVCAR